MEDHAKALATAKSRWPWRWRRDRQAICESRLILAERIFEMVTLKNALSSWTSNAGNDRINHRYGLAGDLQRIWACLP